jgi:bifunctional DNA-binding transcriptional regulator/antitoxin component of YhaV-PrlF toxin-antitoxin module
MTTKLPDELRTTVNAEPGKLVQLIDEQTQRAYVLVPADEFRRLTNAAEDDLDESYLAQIESAMNAGWME